MFRKIIIPFFSAISVIIAKFDMILEDSSFGEIQISLDNRLRISPKLPSKPKFTNIQVTNSIEFNFPSIYVNFIQTTRNSFTRFVIIC